MAYNWFCNLKNEDIKNFIKENYKLCGKSIEFERKFDEYETPYIEINVIDEDDLIEDSLYFGEYFVLNNLNENNAVNKFNLNFSKNQKVLNWFKLLNNVNKYETINGKTYPTMLKENLNKILKDFYNDTINFAIDIYLDDNNFNESLFSQTILEIKKDYKKEKSKLKRFTTLLEKKQYKNFII